MTWDQTKLEAVAKLVSPGQVANLDLSANQTLQAEPQAEIRMLGSYKKQEAQVDLKAQVDLVNLQAQEVQVDLEAQEAQVNLGAQVDLEAREDLASQVDLKAQEDLEMSVRPK